MGTIDSMTITLTCTQCSATESDRVLDKGSGWSGSHWGRPSFTKFDAKVSGGGRDEPKVTAECKACGATATVSGEYAT